MKIVGITGGSGSGKGLVSKIMHELGAGWVDADVIYRKLCETDARMLKDIDNEFGGVLDKTGKLDRRKLAQIVFADSDKLKRLNEVSFPFIRDASMKEISLHSEKPFVLFDAPTLFETGADVFCDDTVGVLVDKAIRIKRIIDRDGIEEAAARARIDAQPDEAFYRERCGHIITNSGSLASVRCQAEALFKELLRSESQEIKYETGRIVLR